MNRLSKISLVCAIFAAIFAVNLDAQSSLQTTGAIQKIESTSAAKVNPNPAAPIDTAKNAEVRELPPQAPPALFYIGASPEKDVPSIFSSWWPRAIALPITNSVVCSWIVAGIILIIVRTTTRKNIKEIPSGMQNVIEALVEGWENLMGDILDKRVTRWVFPFAVTFFIFIIISNFVDVIPGVGSIGVGTPDKHSSLPFAIENVHRPFFRPPTTDANLTVAMAGIFLVMSLYWAVRYNGFWGLVKHIFGVKVKLNKWLLPPLVLMFLFIGLMDMVSIAFARPVALAMRLYGNIFAGSTIMDMTFHMKSWLWSILLSVVAYSYDAFECLVQAFVFAILVVAFVGTLCSPTNEQSGH